MCELTSQGESWYNIPSEDRWLADITGGVFLFALISYSNIMSSRPWAVAVGTIFARRSKATTRAVTFLNPWQATGPPEIKKRLTVSRTVALFGTDRYVSICTKQVYHYL